MKNIIFETLVNIDIGPNIDCFIDYEEILEEKSIQINKFNKNINSSLDELNIILYDIEFFGMINKYDIIAFNTNTNNANLGKNLSQYIIKYSEESLITRTIVGSLRGIFTYNDIKNYPFILYFIFEYCLKITYWQQTDTLWIIYLDNYILIILKISY